MRKMRRTWNLSFFFDGAAIFVTHFSPWALKCQLRFPPFFTFLSHSQFKLVNHFSGDVPCIVFIALFCPVLKLENKRIEITTKKRRKAHKLAWGRSNRLEKMRIFTLSTFFWFNFRILMCVQWLVLWKGKKRDYKTLFF